MQFPLLELFHPSFSLHNVSPVITKIVSFPDFASKIGLVIALQPSFGVSFKSMAAGLP